MSLRIHGLEAGYRPGIPVIKDMDFELESGAIGFIGRNGAGKSCLALTLSGALSATAGSIELDGRDVTSTRSRGRVHGGISLVPEGRMVFGQLTVKENLIAAAYGAQVRRPRIGEMEERFPILGEKRNRAAASLSGGEQQLLAIARALVQEPKVVILDEPSLGLSPVAIDRLTVTLKELLDDSSVRFVLMEQNGEILTGLCDQVLLVEQGVVLRSLDMGSPADQSALYNSYLGV